MRTLIAHLGYGRILSEPCIIVLLKKQCYRPWGTDPIELFFTRILITTCADPAGEIGVTA